MVLILASVAAFFAPSPGAVDAVARIGTERSGLVPPGVAPSGKFVLCERSTLRRDCVIDGDTIRYRGLKIRLADIDAPETWKPQCASEAARGEKAKERLLELLNAGPIELVSSGWRDEDRYGRKLRIVELGGRSLGNILISDEGLARPWNGARKSWRG